jgi:hypothetical protein
MPCPWVLSDTAHVTSLPYRRTSPAAVDVSPKPQEEP